jgi:two-component system NarL family sensor kinase
LSGRGANKGDEGGSEPTYAPQVIWVTPGGRRPQSGVQPVSVPRTVAHVTIAGVVLVFALAVVGGALARDVGDELGVDAFERLAGVTAASLAPAVDADPTLPPDAAGDLDRQVSGVLSAGPVAAVSIRDASGRVVWSDRADTIGEVTPLASGARRALDTGSVVCAVDVDAAGSPLVAHAGIRDVHGTPVLLDLTERPAGSPAVPRQVWLALVPPALVALLLLVAIVLPLTWRLAAQVRHHQRHDAVLLRAAVDAPEGERRRLAGELHDTVLPVLSGVAMELDAARMRAGSNGASEVRLPPGVVASVRRAIDDLRALVSGPGPAQERVPDLAGRLRSLAAEQEHAGLRVSVDASGAAGLPDPVARLLYRSAREALRNAVTHSRASSAEVTVAREGPTVTLVVDDDGRGFEQQELAERRRAGHVGLDTLGDLVVRAGGSVTANSAPGQGTRLVVSLPVDAAAVGALR